MIHQPICQFRIRKCSLEDMHWRSWLNPTRVSLPKILISVKNTEYRRHHLHRRHSIFLFQHSPIVTKSYSRNLLMIKSIHWRTEGPKDRKGSQNSVSALLGPMLFWPYVKAILALESCIGTMHGAIFAMEECQIDPPLFCNGPIIFQFSPTNCQCSPHRPKTTLTSGFVLAAHKELFLINTLAPTSFVLALHRGMTLA
jgi:hypothetical protein